MSRYYYNLEKPINLDGDSAKDCFAKLAQNREAQRANREEFAGLVTHQEQIVQRLCTVVPEGTHFIALKAAYSWEPPQVLCVTRRGDALVIEPTAVLDSDALKFPEPE